MMRMEMKADPQSILIILHGSIGDVTRALPLANLLRRRFPDAKLAWSVEPPCLPLVEGYRAIDEVIVFDRFHWWRGIASFLRKVRARRFDLVLDLQRHLKSGLISVWSGAPYRVGFNRQDCKEFNWIFNNHFIPALGDGISKLQHYMKFAEYLGINSSPIGWDFSLNAEEEGNVKRLLHGVAENFAVLFVSSRWESKRWFPSQIADCARMVQQRYHLDAVLLGSPQDEGIADELPYRDPRRTRDLVGRTSLREVLGIIRRARVAIGPDTGLMHIAAAVGTPVVSLWGATSPQRAGPHGFEHLVVQGSAACAPCYRRRCPIHRICMQSISAEEIGAKLETALGGSPSEDHNVGRRA
jgi:lipopolysaccharide heptosyltransferase II